MKKILLLIFISLYMIGSNAQVGRSPRGKVYNLNYKVELPVTLGLLGLNYVGFSKLNKKPRLDSLEIVALNTDDIWSFDQRAIEQGYPAPSNTLTLSDIGLISSFFLPAFLFFNDEIRQQWLDITLLYIDMQAINLTLYVWGGPAFTERIRPIVYKEGSWDFKLGKSTTDSFFSGHVSMSAGASFFMAKVYSDYHPELGPKKWLLYTAALIPPAFVGYYRYRGFMHFPSDVLVGAAVGAAVGILVPHLHKITGRSRRGISLIPFTGRYSGLAMSMGL